MYILELNEKGKQFFMTKIREFRKQKNMSQNYIANLMGIKQNTFSQWETEYRNPSIRQAIKLAEILDTTVEELYK